jgi:hypothetical protein
MLMMTPTALARLRSETRAPVTLAPVSSAPPKKLARHRREAIIDKLAAMMRRAEPTPFALEGPARAAIRARICMGGWRWGAADAAADDCVQAALARVGARRPDWKQGQPEYTQDGYAPRTRERCARCAKPLPEGNYRYCGPVCAKAADVDRRARQDKDERYAKEKIYRLAYAEKQQPRECQLCGTWFRPKHISNKYCSPKCGYEARDNARNARAEAGRIARRNMRVVCEAVHDDANR